MALAGLPFSVDILPMSRAVAPRGSQSVETRLTPRRIVFVAYPGVLTLDLAGPAEVFCNAQRLFAVPYQVVLGSMSGGRCESTAFALDSVRLPTLRISARDTLVVAGAPDAALQAALADRALLSWLSRAAARAERIVSVCSGAFLLAALGLLDGRFVTTHWSSTAELQRYRPAARVKPNELYVESDRIWSSAGVTAGIDLALALVARDCGSHIAGQVASNLVLYAHRPGGQAQFSPVLVTQNAERSAGAELLVWARQHLRELSPERFAHQAGMSLRSFHRQCRSWYGASPALLIRRLRAERARELVTATRRPLKWVAAHCGFASPHAFAATFAAEFGVLPSQMRQYHSPPSGRALTRGSRDRQGRTQ